MTVKSKPMTQISTVRVYREERHPSLLSLTRTACARRSPALAFVVHYNSRTIPHGASTLARVHPSFVVVLPERAFAIYILHRLHIMCICTVLEVVAQENRT